MIHKRRFVLGLLSCCMVALALLQTTVVQAQEKDEFLLSFRMKDYKTQHSHDQAATDELVKTLKALKCEVSVNAHGNHIDVKWRTVVWKMLALKDEQQVAQWESWLKKNGFETLYGRPAGKTPKNPNSKNDTHAEIVQYRAQDWQTMHVHDTSPSGTIAIFKGLGCEVAQEKHAGHIDLRIRCEQWMEIEVGSHKLAVAWEKYLKDAGFEAKHEHRH